MKSRIALLFTVVFLLAAAAQAGTPPSLVGVWKGDVELHFKTKGFHTNTQSVSFEVLEQQGHLFHGVKQWTNVEGEQHSETFSGVIDYNGKRLQIAEHEDGLILGDIVSADHMVFYYLEHGDNPKAFYYDLKLMK